MNHKFDVFALGNALVDYEFRMSESWLAENKMEKGLMTLIDAQQLIGLRQKLEKLIQANQFKRACGGSAANTAIAISQFGGSSYYACRIADDENGHFYADDLTKENVHHAFQGVHRPQIKGTTGCSYVLLTDDADRTMNTFLGISQEFSLVDVDLTALQKSSWLYVEGYLVASPSAQKASVACLQQAKAQGVKTSLTLSDPNMARYFRSGLNEMIEPGLDLLFCNYDEAKEYFVTSELSEIAQAAKKVAKTFVITLGPDGCLVFDGHSLFEMPAIKHGQEKVIDTVGAGDMFAGAFLYGLTRQKNFKQCAQFANHAAGKIITHFGPRLPTKVVQELLKSAVNHQYL
jgi:sugar/nucleoside kinase (ribokinase family)